MAKKSNKHVINKLPDGSCFAVVPQDEAVDFIQKLFGLPDKDTVNKKRTKNKRK